MFFIFGLWGRPLCTVRLEPNSHTDHTIALLYDYLLQQNLSICNKSNDPTCITRNRREVLDISLISDPLLNQLEAWKLGIEHSFSDHRYIEFKITLDCPTENITNLRLTNFENFGHTTKNKIFRLVKLLADLSTRL